MMKTCPFCAEEIQDAAIKCKHCGSNLKLKNPTPPETIVQHPTVIHNAPKSSWFYKFVIFLIGFSILSIFVASCNFAKGNSNLSIQGVQESAENKQYELMLNEDAGVVRNLYAFATGDVSSNENIDSVIVQIERLEKCNHQCNISLYNDREALNLDLQKRKMTEPKLIEQWKKEHEDFVAEHWIAYKSFDMDGEPFFYPIKTK